MAESKLGSVSQESVDVLVFRDMGHPLWWCSKGDELRSAAEILWASFWKDQAAYSRQITEWRRGGSSKPSPKAPVLEPSLMLMGLALENIFKALIVSQRPGCLDAGALPASLRTHDLKRLAKSAALTLDAEESGLCEIAGAAAKEFGRYPVSQNHERRVTTARKVTNVFLPTFTRLFDRVSALMPRTAVSAARGA